MVFHIILSLFDVRKPLINRAPDFGITLGARLTFHHPLLDLVPPGYDHIGDRLADGRYGGHVQLW